jgi:iron complex outermembrane receptor protein
MTWKIGIVATALMAAPAAAQDNAIKSAEDAFGERSGIEQAGLYSETQVRGFDLNDSGGYRIDDAYFNRASPLDDTILSGVSVRVGVSAARLAYPAPSGVVNYRLRDAGPVNELRLGAGFRDFGTRVVQGDFSLRTGSLGLAGGVLWLPESRYAAGYWGKALRLGAVGSWDIAPGHRLRIFGSLNRRNYDGDYSVIPIGTASPPSLKQRHQYSPDWARTSAENRNFGLLYHGGVAGFDIDLSAFHSVFDMSNVDITLISADAKGDAKATTYRSPIGVNSADSAELRVARQFKSGDLSHIVTVSVRGGRARKDLYSYLPVDLGAFNLRGDDPPDPPEPVWTGTRGNDRVRQIIASAGYSLAWKDVLQLRLAAHRTRYDKSVLTIAGARSRRVTNSMHYNVSAIANLTARTSVFGSWVTGLEENGYAPTAATNRDEVLPPGDSKQFELGVRHGLSPGLTLIGAIFDISKPSVGFRADGSFGEVGQVRHRGAETSISGKLDARTNLVLGLVAFRSSVSGPLVEAGAIGSHDPGVSNLVINANAERQVANGWSVDAGLSYSGSRWIDTANSFKVPAFTTVNLGMRGRFEVAHHRADLRVLASNITNTQGYMASRSGELSPIPPRTVRAVLTVTLAPNRGSGQ